MFKIWLFFNKITLIGKFVNITPRVELIRKNFILQTQLPGGVKIAHFNSRPVYIDLDNELDYNMVWTKQRMTIVGQVMRIQAWTHNFKPAEETHLVEYGFLCLNYHGIAIINNSLPVCYHL